MNDLIAFLRSHYSYDPETGYIKCIKVRDGRPPSYPVKKIYYKGHTYTAYRAAWMMVTGEVPNVIDHINGDPNDNRWCNLRNVTQAENVRNTKLYRHNKTGRTGVHETKTGTWSADIIVNGKQIRIGTYPTFTLACAARRAAEEKYGFIHRGQYA